MYTIELDVDPVTLGFDPKEVTKNADGTYTVTRRFIHAVHQHDAGGSYRLEGYCPCLTDDVEIFCYQVMDHKGRITYGANYITNGGARQNNESRSFSNSMTDFLHPIGPGVFNRKYDTHIEDREQEKAASFLVSSVNDHPANLRGVQKEYFEQYHIVFGQSAPTDPYHDPFLPEKFKQMLGDAYNGDKNA